MANFLAIDADARGLFVAAGTLRNGAVTVDRTAHLADAPPLGPASAADLGVKLQALLKETGIRPAPVLLLLGRDRLILKDVRHPPAPPVEEPAIVRFQAIRDLSESPDDVVMDYSPLPPVSTGERRATVVFVRKEVLTAARVFCEKAGLKLAAITPRPFVAGDLLRRADAATPPDAALGLLTLWPTGGEFTIVRGRDVLFSRALSAVAIANERALTGELRRNLTVYAGQFPSDPLGGVYVAESDNGRPGWADFLGDTLRVPFFKLDPLAGTPAAEGVPDTARGRFAGPVGLLTAKAALNALPINFAAPRQPRAEANPHKKRILLAALFGIVLVGGLAAAGYAEVEQAGRRVAEAKQQKDSLETELKALELDKKRLDGADEFTNREVVWFDELYDISARIPDVRQMKITQLSGTALPPPKQPVKSVSQTSTTAPGAKPAAVAVTPTVPEKPVPVGKLVLTVTTENTALVDKLVDNFREDKFYVETGRNSKGLSGTGTVKVPQFEVKTEIIHRKPTDYSRKLDVSAPKPQAQPNGKPVDAPEDDLLGDNQ